MTATAQFIEDAIAGGWRWKYYPLEAPEFELCNANSEGVVATWKHNGSSFFIDIDSAVLDPLAWQAVGKTRGWKEAGIYSSNTHRGIKDGCWRDHQWKISLHRFLDHLADGKTIEEALALL